jgi:hypothetical protein
MKKDAVTSAEQEGGWSKRKRRLPVHFKSNGWKLNANQKTNEMRASAVRRQLPEMSCFYVFVSTDFEGERKKKANHD